MSALSVRYHCPNCSDLEDRLIDAHVNLNFAVERFQGAEARLAKLREAAAALMADIHSRHPGEELRCPFLRALELALNDTGDAP